MYIQQIIKNKAQWMSFYEWKRIFIAVYENVPIFEW